jgi:hypothetical protein
MNSGSDLIPKGSVLLQTGAWFRRYHDLQTRQLQEINPIGTEYDKWKRYWTEFNRWYWPGYWPDESYLHEDKSPVGRFFLGMYYLLKLKDITAAYTTFEEAGDYPLALYSRACLLHSANTPAEYALFLQAAHLGVDAAIHGVLGLGQLTHSQKALWAQTLYQFTLSGLLFEYLETNNPSAAGQFGHWTPHYITHQCVHGCVRNAIFQWLLISQHNKLPRDIRLLIASYICTAGMWLHIEPHITLCLLCNKMWKQY